MTGVAEGLTAAACFPEREATMRENIDLSVWTNYFNEFTRRNRSRPTRLEVFGGPGAQQAECRLPFAGIALDSHRFGLPSIEIMLGGHDARGPSHLKHVIANVLEITPKLGLDGRDAAIEIISAQGETSLLRFETQGMLRA
jgi:hypothetical protein